MRAVSVTGKSIAARLNRRLLRVGEVRRVTVSYFRNFKKATFLTYSNIPNLP